MHLILVRHGPAQDRDEFAARGRPDPERPLTDAGRRKTRDAAAGLARVVEAPVRIVTSPYVRARETAEIISAACDSAPVRSVSALAPGGRRDRVLAGLGVSGSAILVGHEPDLGMLLGWLVTGRLEVWHAFKKAGAACVTFAGRPTPGTGGVEWILPPNALRALGRLTKP